MDQNMHATRPDNKIVDKKMKKHDEWLGPGIFIDLAEYRIRPM